MKNSSSTSPISCEDCPFSLLCLAEQMDLDGRGVEDMGICPICGIFWIQFDYVPFGEGSGPGWQYEMFFCSVRRLTGQMKASWMSKFKRQKGGDLRGPIANDCRSHAQDPMYHKSRPDKGWLPIAPCTNHAGWKGEISLLAEGDYGDVPVEPP